MFWKNKHCDLRYEYSDYIGFIKSEKRPVYSITLASIKQSLLLKTFHDRVFEITRNVCHAAIKKPNSFSGCENLDQPEQNKCYLLTF